MWQFDSLKQAADRCVAELGSIDFVMCVFLVSFISPVFPLF